MPPPRPARPTGCPHFSKRCPTQPHTRSLAAQGAEVEQVERVAYCPDCRRDFFPLRIPLGLDEHGYSSSVVERVVAATARFSSFRDATDAARMAGIDISESPVRRLAHEVGAERIAQRDQKVNAHRRRQLAARTAAIPPPWQSNLTAGGFAPERRTRPPAFTTPRTRRTRSLARSRYTGRRLPPTRVT